MTGAVIEIPINDGGQASSAPLNNTPFADIPIRLPSQVIEAGRHAEGKTRTGFLGGSSALTRLRRLILPEFSVFHLDRTFSGVAQGNVWTRGVPRATFYTLAFCSLEGVKETKPTLFCDFKEEGSRCLLLRTGGRLAIPRDEVARTIVEHVGAARSQRRIDFSPVLQGLPSADSEKPFWYSSLENGLMLISGPLLDAKGLLSKFEFCWVSTADLGNGIFNALLDDADRQLVDGCLPVL